MASKELNEIRLANTLRLFEAFCEQIAPGAPDLLLGISPSYWAQIKSPKRLKGIGPNLARQFERKFTLSPGWLDKDHGDAPVMEPPENYAVDVATLEEKEFLEAALECFRDNPVKTQRALNLG
jgi:hypothetical protein